MRPRPTRFQRDADCRIVAVRSASDPWWDLDFLRDPAVKSYFAERDRQHQEREARQAAEVRARVKEHRKR